MGHGIDSGIVTTLALTSYRNSRREGLSLPDIVCRLDRLVEQQFPDDRFITGVLAELNLHTGHLSVVNAGSPQPLLLHAGQCRPLNVDPVPPMGLGLTHHHTPQVTEAVLVPGDLLLLATDGVLDPRIGDRAAFSEQQLGSFVENTARHKLPLDEATRQITRRVRQAQDDKLADDASVLLLEYFGSPGIRPAADTAPRV